MTEEIEILSEALKAYSQADFTKTEEQRLGEVLDVCVKVLKSNGYRVAPPNIGGVMKVTTLGDLVGLFNGFVTLVYGPEAAHYRDGRRDEAVMKHFVNNRRKVTGASPKVAKQECALIIKTIFDNINLFNFTTPPTIGILDSAKCAWIIELALSIMNKREAKAKAYGYELMLNSAGEDYMQGAGMITEDDL